MKLSLQRRVAASILKVGVKKVVFDINELEEIKKAITRDDLRVLIVKGLITKSTKNQQSRVRARKILVQKRKGRQKGQGNRKGKLTARSPPKRTWINKVRIQRTVLKDLKVKGLLNIENYRKMYLRSKGGFFRSKRHILLYMTEHSIIDKNGKKQKK
jgi:large subunit ribosomal protein L19e